MVKLEWHWKGVRREDTDDGVLGKEVRACANYVLGVSRVRKEKSCFSRALADVRVSSISSEPKVLTLVM